jgi:hypothetical protein
MGVCLSEMTGYGWPPEISMTVSKDSVQENFSCLRGMNLSFRQFLNFLTMQKTVPSKKIQ